MPGNVEARVGGDAAMTGLPLGPVLRLCEPVPDLPDGVLGFTTTRAAGSFGLSSNEPVAEVMARWDALQADFEALGIQRLASAYQVHGAEVASHGAGWHGWLRLRGIDGHITTTAGTALAVTVADCTPVVVAHPAGAVAVLHSGWRGTAAGILRVGLSQLAERGFAAAECRVHLGPSICGTCYEVGPEVLEAVTGRPTAGKGCLDVRATLLEQARALGVRAVTVDEGCTRCHQGRYFSHRGGDSGRLLGLVALRSA